MLLFRTMMKILAGAFLTVALLAASQEEETRSVQSGVYTEEQADRGLKIFEGTCVACHDTAEFGDGAYIDSWSGQTAHDMIEHIRETMPQDSPGSLKRMEYVDVTAYLFRLNGLPAGDSEMDVDSVKRIKIEGPFHPSPE
jgi:mono/diheme cytochrome c family protein